MQIAQWTVMAVYVHLVDVPVKIHQCVVKNYHSSVMTRILYYQGFPIFQTMPHLDCVDSR